MLRDYSIFGCGIRSQVRPDEAPGTYRITRWVTLAAAPVLPLSSWRAAYVGEDLPEPFLDPSVRFREVERLPLELVPVLKTCLRGYAAVLPAAMLVVRTEGRAATTWEFGLVILSTVWAAAIMLYALIGPGHRLRKEAARAGRPTLYGAVSGFPGDMERDRCED